MVGPCKASIPKASNGYGAVNTVKSGGNLRFSNLFKKRRPGMLKITTNQFREWLSEATKGSVLLYHEGNLMRDRMVDPKLDLIALEVMKKVDKGEVMVYQKRVVKAEKVEVVEKGKKVKDFEVDGVCGYYARRLG